MKCKMAEKSILTDYIDGNLKGTGLKEVESHIASCERCRELAGQLKAAGELLKSLPRQDAPGAVWEKIAAQIGRERDKRYAAEDIFRRLPQLLLRIRPAVVMVGAAVIVLFIAAALKYMPLSGYSGAIAPQDDIFEASYNGDPDKSDDYDYGTAAEMFFL